MYLLAAVCAQAADNTSERKVKVDDNSFKCITDMTPVRHFYVDNLLGSVEATVAVATAGKGDYPEGSVLQLMPNEVMIKQQKGFNPETHDWEFFYIDVDKNGSKIFARGFADVNNRLGMNCFACHSQAKLEFDLVCEQDHGCAPIPVTRAMFGALHSPLQESAGEPRRRTGAERIGRDGQGAESEPVNRPKKEAAMSLARL